MNKRHTHLVQYVLFALLLAVLDLGVIHAYLSRQTRQQVTTTDTSPALATHHADADPALTTYRINVARSMGILMQSGCFRSSDICCKIADEMIMHTEEGLTLEAYRQYLTDGMSHLWQIRCVEHLPECESFAFGLLRSASED